MHKYISTVIIALTLIGCSGNSSSSSCNQWEVIISPVSQLESKGKSKYGEFDKKTIYKIPQGWEPFGSVGMAWIMLRKCVK